MLRTYYLLELALLQYRAFGTSEELSAQTLATLHDFDQSCAQTLVDMAVYLENQQGKEPQPGQLIHRPLMVAAPVVSDTNSSLSIANQLTTILMRLRDEMLAASLFATE
jgi:hypothetical protein